MQITPNILLYSQPIHSKSLRLQAIIGGIALRENIIVAQNMDQLIRINLFAPLVDEIYFCAFPPGKALFC